MGNAAGQRHDRAQDVCEFQWSGCVINELDDNDVCCTDDDSRRLIVRSITSLLASSFLAAPDELPFGPIVANERDSFPQVCA